MKEMPNDGVQVTIVDRTSQVRTISHSSFELRVSS